MNRRDLVWLGLLVVGCGDDGASVTSDARRADASGSDAAVCGSETHLLNRIVALDSTPDNLVPIDGATVYVIGDDTRSATTGASGLFSLCVPASAPIQLQIDAPGDYLDFVVHLEQSYTDLYDLPSREIRTMTLERAMSFYTDRGLTYDSDAAHLLVLHAFDGGTVEVSATHDTMQASYGADDNWTWMAGASGRLVLVPNVEVTGATTVVTESPSLDPPGPGSTVHTVPIAAGQLTFIVVLLAIGP